MVVDVVHHRPISSPGRWRGRACARPMSRGRTPRIGRQLAAGAVAGAVGTAAMDLLLYQRYRRDGGKDASRRALAAGVTSWEEASAPGQVGQKLERLVTRRPPPDRWARTTTNLVHWATGIGWGLQYGALAGRTAPHPLVVRSRWVRRRGSPATRSSRWRACTSRSGSTTRGRSARTCPPTSSSAA